MFAAVDVLRGVPERRLEWDSELDTAVIRMTRLSDDQVKFTMSWNGNERARSTFAFDISTVQPGVVLAERVLGLADALDPANYVTEWTGSWPAYAIDILRQWLAESGIGPTHS